MQIIKKSVRCDVNNLRIISSYRCASVLANDNNRDEKGVIYKYNPLFAVQIKVRNRGKKTGDSINRLSL